MDSKTYKRLVGQMARLLAKSNTIAAMEAFRRHSDIPINGVIEPGSLTWQALLQAAGETRTEPAVCT